ncbi:pyridoxal-phosphate dependent enzyme [Myxococcota bacterium]|nr:pyridoxal-phosphate dependent enzyme [Myxococcota bacterium]
MPEARPDLAAPIDLGGEGTPVQEAPALCPAPGARLFLKREDLAGQEYGGNKVRKLEHLLATARDQGRPVLTTGAVGSHHVLATAWYGRRLGIAVHAVLGPQPATPHVEQTARASAGLLAGAWPVPRWPLLPAQAAVVAHELERRHGVAPLLVPPGGSSVEGCLGSVRLGLELGRDVAEGRLPEPDQLYLPVGSGGTAAGLWVGLRAAGLGTRLVGVRVAPALLSNRAHVRALAHGLCRRLGWHLRLASDDLVLDTAHLGAGYGHPTAAGEQALARARDTAGLSLESTYSAKAMAACLAHLSGAPTGRVALFLVTANSKPLDPLLASAPPTLPAPLRALLGSPIQR